MTSRRKLGSGLLVFAGSSVDALLIFGFNVLTAAQTGNTILFAVALARRDYVTGLGSAISIAAFVTGAVCGGWICRRYGSRVALWIELLLLLTAFGTWFLSSAAWGNLVITAAALAMGIQSAVIVCIHGQPSTYITGLLTSFAVSVSACSRESSRSVAAQGLVWVIYLGGAVTTGLVFVTCGMVAVLVPIGALTAATLLLPASSESAS